MNVLYVLQNFGSLAERVLKSCLHFYGSGFWFALVLKRAVNRLSGRLCMAHVLRVFRKGSPRSGC